MISSVNWLNMPVCTFIETSSICDHLDICVQKNTCLNGGTCKMNGTAFVCLCRTPYTGARCEKSPCTDGLCLNGGTCGIQNNNYKCLCKEPYSGDKCQTDPCTLKPCLNGGTCKLDGKNFKCNCSLPFSGAKCEIDPCTAKPCLNGGTCKIDGKTFKCNCASPFSGLKCETDPCTAKPCLNGGTCKVEGKTFKCNCASPFSGPKCETDPCTAKPCLNGGTCKVDGKTFKCNCASPFSGPKCETDSCTAKPCLNGGTCKIDGKTFKCNCISPFSGPKCETDPCTAKPCLNGGTCKVDGKIFKCNCASPFSGPNCETECKCENGRCEKDRDGNLVCACPPEFGNYLKHSCKACNCGPAANCTFDPDISLFDGKKCVCPNGYNETKGLCDDACTKNPCRNDGICKLTGKTYKCECKKPFTGKNCEKDPCSDVSCEHGGTCNIKGNSFTCACVPPFFGTTCDKDPCSNHPCGNGGKCSLDATTFFKCSCKVPYFGKKCEEQCSCLKGRCEKNETNNLLCVCPPEFGLQKKGVCKECNCGKNANCTFDTLLFVMETKTCICPPGYREKSGLCQEVIATTTKEVTSKSSTPRIVSTTTSTKIISSSSLPTSSATTKLTFPSSSTTVAIETTFSVSKSTKNVTRTSFEPSNVTNRTTYQSTTSTPKYNRTTYEPTKYTTDYNRTTYVTNSTSDFNDTSNNTNSTNDYNRTTYEPTKYTSNYNRTTYVTTNSTSDFNGTSYQPTNSTYDYNRTTNKPSDYTSDYNSTTYEPTNSTFDYNRTTYEPTEPTSDSNRTTFTSDTTLDTTNFTVPLNGTTCEPSTVNETSSVPSIPTTDFSIGSSHSEVSDSTEQSTYTSKFTGFPSSVSEPDDCSSVFCENGGTCVPSKEGPKCQCLYPYAGVTCKDSHWCTVGEGKSLCPEGSCRFNYATRIGRCECPKNHFYNYDKMLCEAVDLCPFMSETCKGDYETCVKGKCQCEPHFKRNDQNACVPAFCDSNPCGENESCQETGDVLCTCKKDYIFDGKSCKLIDACDVMSILNCQQSCNSARRVCECYPEFGFILQNDNKTCRISDPRNLCNKTCGGVGVCVKHDKDQICLCPRSHVSRRSTCVDLCTAGILPKGVCPADECISDTKLGFRCKCDGKLTYDRTGVTCRKRNMCSEGNGTEVCRARGAICLDDFEKTEGYRCECAKDQEMDTDELCKNKCLVKLRMVESRRRMAKCWTDEEGRVFFTCPPMTDQGADGRCTEMAKVSYTGFLPIIARKNSSAKNAPEENLLEGIRKDLRVSIHVLYGNNFKSAEVLDCQASDGTTWNCSVEVQFRSDPKEQANLPSESCLTLEDGSCLLPPKLLLRRTELRTDAFSATNPCQKELKVPNCGSTETACRRLGKGLGFECTCASGFESFGSYRPFPTDDGAIVHKCRDVDECATEQPSACPNNSTSCLNTYGSFECLCLEGFHRSPGSPQCTEICDQKNCLHGTCVVVGGSTFQCRCQSGYTGVNCDQKGEASAPAAAGGLRVALIILSTLVVPLILVSVYLAYKNRTLQKEVLKSNYFDDSSPIIGMEQLPDISHSKSDE